MIKNMHSLKSGCPWQQDQFGRAAVLAVVKNCSSSARRWEAIAGVRHSGIAAFAAVCLFMRVYYRLLAWWVHRAAAAGGRSAAALSVAAVYAALPALPVSSVHRHGRGRQCDRVERIKEGAPGGQAAASAVEAGFHKAFSSVFETQYHGDHRGDRAHHIGSGPSMLSFGYYAADRRDL